MKRLICFLAVALAAGAQTITQSSSATATGEQTDIRNMSANPAIGWRLTFWYTGFSAVTMQIDCAPDNGSGAAGSYAACGGAVDGTTNPVTVSSSPQAGTIALKIYSPHVAVNITSATGSGKVNWTITGLWGAFNVPTTVSTSGGGGGGGVVETVCDPTNSGAQKQTTLSGTGYNSLVGAVGGKVIQVCNIAVTSASGGTPSVNTFNVAVGNCAGSPTQILTLAGVTGYTDNFFGTLEAASGGDLCFKESVANSDLVTVTYLQH